MKLDFVDNVNEHGDNLVRLFNFNKAEAKVFKDCLIATVIEGQQPLIVDQLEFVEAKNCRLTLKLSDEDLGILTEDKKKFVCELTLKSYKQIVAYIEPFCKKDSKAFRMLYDIDSLTDLMFIPSAT